MSFPGSADTLASYGGALVDKDGIPVIDPTTDRGAAAVNQAFAATAGMTHTATKAWARLVTSATTPSLAATNPSDAVWGNAAPVLPTPLRTGTGVFTLTFPTTVTDELGNTQSVLFRWAYPSVEGATAYKAQCSVTAANVITVYTFTASGTASDIAGATVLVKAG